MAYLYPPGLPGGQSHSPPEYILLHEGFYNSDDGGLSDFYPESVLPMVAGRHASGLVPPPPRNPRVPMVVSSSWYTPDRIEQWRRSNRAAGAASNRGIDPTPMHSFRSGCSCHGEDPMFDGRAGAVSEPPGSAPSNTGPTPPSQVNPGSHNFAFFAGSPHRGPPFVPGGRQRRQRHGDPYLPDQPEPEQPREPIEEPEDPDWWREFISYPLPPGQGMPRREPIATDDQRQDDDSGSNLQGYGLSRPPLLAVVACPPRPHQYGNYYNSFPVFDHHGTYANYLLTIDTYQHERAEIIHHGVGGAAAAAGTVGTTWSGTTLVEGSTRNNNRNFRPVRQPHGPPECEHDLLGIVRTRDEIASLVRVLNRGCIEMWLEEVLLVRRRLWEAVHRLPVPDVAPLTQHQQLVFGQLVGNEKFREESTTRFPQFKIEGFTRFQWNIIEEADEGGEDQSGPSTVPEALANMFL